MKRHKKKRNSALLYEFLVRHISYCLINDRKDEAKKALELSKRYFSKGTALHEEMKLINVVLDAKVASRQSAQRIIDEIVSCGSKLNARKIDVEKSKLIKEINYSFKDVDLYGYKVPNYAVYASTQTLLSEGRMKKKSISSVDRIKLEDKILEHLVREEKTDVVKDQLKVNPKYNNVVYKFVIERFNKKYDKALTESQKKLLTKYIVYLLSENTGVIKSAIQKEVISIKDKLRNVKDRNIVANNDLMQNLNECYKKLAVTDFENITEENILDLLKYMQLAEEIDNNG